VRYVATFGVFVSEGGYKDLVGWPPLKSVKINDWPEEGGIDPDLSDPKLGSRTFGVNFGCTNAAKIHEFLGLLSGKPYVTFDFREIGLIKRLRLVSQPSLQTVATLGSFSLQFADDTPPGEYILPEPTESFDPSGYQMDDRDLSEYGIRLTEGLRDAIRLAPAVKPNRSADVSTVNGVIYDDDNVVYKEKEVGMRCVLKAAPNMFWAYYYALLTDLTRPGERQLNIVETEEYFNFYYKSASVGRFTVIPSGEFWCEFTVNLIFTSYRPGQTEYLLTSEAGELFVSEESSDKRSIFFNMHKL
jgi:hypothetical protein